jgi:hypothetical protein
LDEIETWSDRIENPVPAEGNLSDLVAAAVLINCSQSWSPGEDFDAVED